MNTLPFPKNQLLQDKEQLKSDGGIMAIIKYDGWEIKLLEDSLCKNYIICIFMTYFVVIVCIMNCYIFCVFILLLPIFAAKLFSVFV